MLVDGADYKQLVQSVLGDLQHDATTCCEEALLGRAILAPKNSDVNAINDYVSNLFPQRLQHYLSADCVGQDDNVTTYQTEYLNTLQPQGFPPHHLKLKVGLPIMLLRNISPTLGLANGTHLLITNLRQHVLVVKILTGSSAHVGIEALIPRCTLTSNEKGLPFTLIRRHFPIKPTFAMTINKSQGQTFRSVGVYLPSPVFSHGQLYVAMSRVGQALGLSIMAAHPRPARATDTTAVYTENVVYTEVFDALPPGPDEGW